MYPIQKLAAALCLIAAASSCASAEDRPAAGPQAAETTEKGPDDSAGGGAGASDTSADDAKQPSTRVLGARTWVLEAGLAAEVDFQAGEGDRALGYFEADAPVVVDTHQHRGDERISYGSGTGSGGRLTFTVPEDGLFSFGFTHPGGDGRIVVKMQLQGDVEVVRWIVGPAQGGAFADRPEPKATPEPSPEPTP